MQSFKIAPHASLIVRSLVSVSILMVLILGMFGYRNVQQFREDALKNLLQENRYISDITSEAISLSVWNLDEALVRKQLESLKHAETFCGARVLDPQGKVFVEVSFPVTLLETQQVLDTNIVYQNSTKDMTKNEILGVLQLCSDRSILNERLQDALYRHLIFTILLIFVVLLACYISMLIILRPLHGIRQAMIRLKDTMEPIRDPSLLKHNEIGVLTRSFNQMVENLTNTYRELRVAKEAAEQASAAKSEFLSNISHELRTPMHAILGFSRRALDKTEEPKIKEFLADIQISGNRLIRLINALLDLSRFESGKADMHLASCDMKQVVQHSMRELDALAQDQNISVVLQTESETGLTAEIDREKITQVMINLLSNAIKFSEEKGSIIIQVKPAMLEQKVAVSVSVSDGGVGVPPEELGEIFDKFVQSSKTKTGAGGTGLGLSICKEIIRMHNGKIWAENNPQKGAIFTFTIPVNHKAE